MDRIVDRSGVTKGALYHHFGSKKELAHAVIDGMIRGMVVDSFTGPLAQAANPIDGLQSCLRDRTCQLTPEMVSFGCPLNNLAQELAGSDDDFQEQIEGLHVHWRAAIADALVRGQKAGLVRKDIDVSDVATFTVATISGMAGFMKSTRDADVAQASVRVLCAYLDTLRTPST